MIHAEAIARLKAVEPALRERGVAALYLFGSHARDGARTGSDLDVFVDPADENAIGLTPFMETFTVLQQTFPGIELGYSTRDSVVPCDRPYIEDGAIRVF